MVWDVQLCDALVGGISASAVLHADTVVCRPALPSGYFAWQAWLMSTACSSSPWQLVDG